MTHFDVFNGDADGICSLLQLRLETPADAILVTGAKRDIALLQRVEAQRGDAVTVLDISADENRHALMTLLERGVAIKYFDHHFAGELPSHPALDAHIDTSPRVCTGILVDRYLAGKQRIWAVVAAFGDNLSGPARELAASLPLGAGDAAQLRELGENIAYNAYGDTESDLIIHPAALYQELRRVEEPFRFMQTQPVFRELSKTRRDDLERARKVEPALAHARARIYVLPDAPWARRVRGVFGNELANAAPDVANAVLTQNAQGGYTVSVRAPSTTSRGADALCRQFPTGGGREAAAGINDLPVEQLPVFTRCFAEAFS